MTNSVSRRTMAIGVIAISALSLWIAFGVVIQISAKLPISTQKPPGNCDIPLVETIPEGAIAIVGHAYGSPYDPAILFDERVIALLAENHTKIKHVFFTGDVTAQPTVEKWLQIKDVFANIGLGFSIAPGNHDVGFGPTSRREIFVQVFGNPVIDSLTIGKNIFFIEDSTSNDWKISEDVLSAISGSTPIEAGGRTFLLRHHIPVVEMARLANSREGAPERMPLFKKMANVFGDQHLTIIAGDSGAFDSQPRFFCYSYENLDIITNGLGGLADDEIILVHGAEILRFRL